MSAGRSTSSRTSSAAAAACRILAATCDPTREGLALVADTSLSGARVSRELDAVIRPHARPKTIVSDNATELTSRAMLRWQGKAEVA